MSYAILCIYYLETFLCFSCGAYLSLMVIILVFRPVVRTKQTKIINLIEENSVYSTDYEMTRKVFVSIINTVSSNFSRFSLFEVHPLKDDVPFDC